MTLVRAATPGDVDAVAALEDAVFGPDAWPWTAVADELTGSLRRCVVAVDSAGHICGYLVLLGLGPVADLQRIAVAEASRRHGVGPDLLAACDLTAFDRVLLEVRADNDAALAFYRWQGFGEIDRRAGYYADGVDAVVLQRGLSAPADR